MGKKSKRCIVILSKLYVKYHHQEMEEIKKNYDSRSSRKNVIFISTDFDLKMPEQNGYTHEHGQPLLNQHERSLEKLENFLKDDSCTKIKWKPQSKSFWNQLQHALA